MGSRYLLGDFREGRVARPGIFEAVLRHRDGVRAAMPFAHEPSTRLQSEARIWTNPARGPEHLRQCLELATGRLAEPTVLKLLAPIGDPAKEKIAADPWGLAAVEPPPFAAELVKAGACPVSFGPCNDSFGAELGSLSRSSATEWLGLLITDLL